MNCIYNKTQRHLPYTQLAVSLYSQFIHYSSIVNSTPQTCMNGRLQENSEAEASAHAQEHVFVLFFLFF